MSRNFYDEFGAVLLYWPVWLDESSQSAQLVIGLDTPAVGYQLRATNDVKVRAMARLHGTTDPFMDLGVSPIDLGGFVGPITQFDIYVSALTPIVGLERHVITLVAGQNVMAGYDN